MPRPGEGLRRCRRSLPGVLCPAAGSPHPCLRAESSGVRSGWPRRSSRLATASRSARSATGSSRAPG